MKNTISYLFLILIVITSCQEEKNNKSIEIDSKEISINPIPSRNKVDTLANQNLITNKIDPTLPTPDSTFFIDLDSSDVNAILQKYVDYYKIRSTYTDNNDGSYLIELKNYSLEEVNRVLRILFTKENEANSDLDGWEKDIYYYQGMCNLEILKGNSTIILNFGCSC
jgi:hypothetical protein